MNRISHDQQVEVMRHVLAGHGINGTHRATGVHVDTISRLNKRVVAGELPDVLAGARALPPPNAIDAAPNRANVWQRDRSNRLVEPVSSQVRPHPLRPSKKQKRGRPLQTESGREISHEQALRNLIALTATVEAARPCPHPGALSSLRTIAGDFAAGKMTTGELADTLEALAAFARAEKTSTADPSSEQETRA